MLDARPAPWAVVVDDRDDDAIGILNALSLLGISAVRYNGDDLMPANSLPHVRLLFLDLELGGGTLDIKRTVGLVFQILAPTISAGPCLIVLWTAHTEEDGNAFRQQFDKYNLVNEPAQQIHPLDIIALSKQDYVVSSTGSTVSGEDRQAAQGAVAYAHDRLMTRLSKALAAYKSLGVLVHWEALNAEAASKTTAGLFRVSTIPTGRTVQDEALQDMLTELACAASGKSMKNPRKEEKMHAAFEILAVLQADMVQRLATGMQDGSPLHSPKQHDKDAQIAALNTILLTSAENDPLQPGAVLLASRTNSEAIPFKASVGEKSYRQFLNCVFKAAYRNRHDNRRINERCIPVFVEVTPSCDHANDKRRMLRFIPGLLVPFCLENLLPLRADHLRVIGPLLHEGEIVSLVLDTLHFFTLPLDASLPQAIFRLRDHLRTDIQAWLGNQLARPGHVSLDMHGA